LGAGASKSCGAPLMCNFLDIASRLYAEGKVKNEEIHFQNVFESISKLQLIHSKAQLDLTNIESIYTSFEMGLILGKLPGIKAEEIIGLIKSLKVVIYRTLEESIKYKVDKHYYIHPPNDYDKFSKTILEIQSLTPRKNITLITFNYDIALDYSLFRNNLIPNYGFIDLNDNSIPLLKLHGSLNWAIRKDNNEILTLNMREYFQKHSINHPMVAECKVPIASHLSEYYKKYENIDVEDEPVIIPPSWNKLEYQKMIKSIWGKAASALERAEYIFIIGYSMPETDSFFRLLYAIGTVGEVLLKKLIIINTDASDEIKDRFKDILGPSAISRLVFNINSFEKCFDQIKHDLT